MKRLIIALFVLLTGLSLASAAEANDATGGYILITPNLAPVAVANVGFFNFYGPDWTMPGQFLIDPSMNDFASAVPGTPFHFSFTQETLGCGVTSSLLIVSLTVQGVEWGGSCATLTVTGQTEGPVTGPGYFTGIFALDSSFEGGNFPFAVSGGGSFDINIPPGTSYVNRADFYVQPSAVPEPSTTSLLLIAFAGLAIVGRRRSRAMLLPTV